MRTRAWRFLSMRVCSACLMCVATACGRGTVVQEEGSTFTFPDSIIATTVEMDESQAVAWSVGREPKLVIGDESGAGEFGRLAFALRLPDGRFVGADEQGQRLVIFDSLGVYQATWGRSGRGPGEFLHPAWLGICAGNLYAFDASQRTVHVFALDSTYKESVRPTIADNGHSLLLHPTQLLACNSAGAVAAAATTWHTAPGGPAETERTPGPYRTLEVVGFGQLGATLDGIITVGGEDRYRYRSGDGPLHVFGRRPLLALTTRHLFVATGDQYEIARYDLASRSWSLLRAARDRLLIVQKEIQDVRARAIADPTLPPGARTQLGRTLDGMTWPVAHPTFKELLVDEKQCLWLRESAPVGEEAQWSVLSASGVITAKVVAPKGFRLFQVRSDELIGRQRDSLGIDRLLVYPLEREASVPCQA